MRTKKRLTEARINNIVHRTVKKAINEAMQPGSISHGTMRNEDVLPSIMSTLFKEDPQKAREIWQENPDFFEALCDKASGIDNPWWNSEDANYISEELFDVMNDYSPEGHYFGSHPGDGSDYGYWPDDEHLDDVVGESIRRAINELDFSTKFSAYQGSRRKGRVRQHQNIGQMIVDEFNNKWELQTDLEGSALHFYMANPHRLVLTIRDAVYWKSDDPDADPQLARLTDTMPAGPRKKIRTAWEVYKENF